jgi:hypothetical protein
MNSGSKKIVVAGLAGLALLGAVAAASSPASAAGLSGHRYVYARYWHHGYYGHPYYYRHRHYGYGAGPAVLGGLFGAIAGAALAPSYYYGPPAYYGYGYGPGPYYYGW